jgi:hypothetical protein
VCFFILHNVMPRLLAYYSLRCERKPRKYFNCIRQGRTFEKKNKNTEINARVTIRASMAMVISLHHKKIYFF